MGSALPSDADTFAFHDALQALMDAARSWLEGTEIRWCEEHRSSAQPGTTRCDEGAYQFVKAERRPRRFVSPYPADCRIVSGRLVTS